jgi:ABC-2 type transport system permease protein
MRDLALAFRQVRYENTAFWRNPAAAFFTFAFPLIFLVIFNVIFGGGTTDRFGNPELSVSNFYIPAVAAFSVITACYTNIAIGVTFARDEGQLKRIRGTPLPGWAYLFGRIAHAIVIAIILVVIVVLFGLAFYDVEIPGKMPEFVAAIALGAIAFAALGLAVTAIIPNPDASPAVTNATILPLLFISDVFIPLDQGTPEWLITLSEIFPIKHFSSALIASYNPTRVDFEAWDLVVMAIWGVIGVFLALRFFSWEPRT